VTKDVPELAPWIRWPVWVLAAVVVLPLRLLWELLQALGGFLVRYVGRPLVWLWFYLVVVPGWWLLRHVVVPPLRLLRELLQALGGFLVRYVGRPLVWLWFYLVVVPGSWFLRHAIVRPLRFLLRYLVIVPLTWLWPGLVLVVPWLAYWLIAVPFAWCWRVSAPLLRFLGQALTALANGVGVLIRGIFQRVLMPGWQGAGWILGHIYRWVLRPVGRAVAWVWRRTVLPVWRVSAAGGRWIRESVLRPTAAMTKSMLAVLGVRSPPSSP
jgi:hypothetical protein